MLDLLSKLLRISRARAASRNQFIRLAASLNEDRKENVGLLSEGMTNTGAEVALLSSEDA